MAEEATAVNDQVVPQEPTTTESAPVEKKDSEVVEPLVDGFDEEPAKDDSKPEPDSKDADADKPTETPAEEPKADERPLSDDANLAPKSVNRFQKLANENKQLREQNEQLLSQIYTPQTPQELMDEGETEAMAEVKAMKQGIEFDKYVQHVTEGQTFVETESSKVLQDFPEFNPESSTFNSERAERAARIIEPLLIRDDNVPEIGPGGQPTGKGIVIGARASLYDIYETIADTSRVSTQEGEIKAQAATEKMLANADVPTSASPPKAKSDPVLDILKSDDY